MKGREVEEINQGKKILTILLQNECKQISTKEIKKEIWNIIQRIIKDTERENIK